MRQSPGLCWLLSGFLWMPGCVLLSSSVSSLMAASPCTPRGVVFVIDGAGGFEVASQTVRQTAAEAKFPLEVHRVPWTHGYCRVISDQMHATHMRCEGHKLAERVLRCREEMPNAQIFLVGHSAGCGVLLIAAEDLPPNTLERIVLLAPAVSSMRDLRPALRSSCKGIDVFTSRHDWVCLGLGVLLAGTTDRCRRTGAAGKNGFQPIVSSPEDEALYSKLRQYPWNPSLSWTGHKGGHYGSYQPKFLRAFVFPLLISSLSPPETRR